MEANQRRESVESIIADRNYHRRAHRALARGSKKLEWAAEVCGRMNWQRPDEAVLYAREAVLRGLYAGEPLCDIEQAMAAGKHNSLCILVAYEVVAPAIQRQLSAGIKARARAREGA
jgi:hypothetical protein